MRKRFDRTEVTAETNRSICQQATWQLQFSIAWETINTSVLSYNAFFLYDVRVIGRVNVDPPLTRFDNVTTTQQYERNPRSRTASCRRRSIPLTAIPTQPSITRIILLQATSACAAKDFRQAVGSFEHVIAALADGHLSLSRTDTRNLIEGFALALLHEGDASRALQVLTLGLQASPLDLELLILQADALICQQRVQVCASSE